jgi:hypothetical protein
MNPPTDADLKFARMLELVAKDLVEQAAAIRAGDKDWHDGWSTYSLEAQAAVHNQMADDGEF